MEFHFVGPVAEPIVSVKHRGILVCLKSPADGLFAANQPAEFPKSWLRPSGTLALERLGQDTVAGEKIIVNQRWGLVQNLMGRFRGVDCQFQRLCLRSILTSYALTFGRLRSNHETFRLKIRSKESIMLRDPKHEIFAPT